MSSFAAKVNETIEALLAEGRVTMADAEAALEAQYGDAMAERSEHLARMGIRRVIKEAFRKAATEDGEESGESSQLGLPGFKEPRAIAVPIGESGDYQYVPFGLATWADLNAGRAERITNVGRATRRLDDYDEKMTALRPHMVGNPAATVAEAAQHIGAPA